MRTKSLATNTILIARLKNTIALCTCKSQASATTGIACIPSKANSCSSASLPWVPSYFSGLSCIDLLLFEWHL